jgi:alpha-beta hydrolase superfamily lysophospholipase
VVLDAQPTIAGLIVSNPVLRLATRVPRHKLWIGSVLRRYAPGVTLRTEIIPERLTSDPVMQAAYGQDVLRHDRISPPLFFGMVEGGPLITPRAVEIRMPVLMILGGADPVVDPEESRAFFERLGSLDKTLLLYPHMLHEPLNELRRDHVISDIAAWLAPRITPSAPPS